MNFLLFAYLLKKHGPRLTMEQLAQGTFPVATYLEGGMTTCGASSSPR